MTDLKALIVAYGEACWDYGALCADGLTEDIEAAEKERDAALAAVMEAIA